MWTLWRKIRHPLNLIIGDQLFRWCVLSCRIVWLPPYTPKSVSLCHSACATSLMGLSAVFNIIWYFTNLLFIDCEIITNFDHWDEFHWLWHTSHIHTHTDTHTQTHRETYTHTLYAHITHTHTHTLVQERLKFGLYSGSLISHTHKHMIRPMIWSVQSLTHTSYIIHHTPYIIHHTSYITHIHTHIHTRIDIEHLHIMIWMW